MTLNCLAKKRLTPVNRFFFDRAKQSITSQHTYKSLLINEKSLSNVINHLRLGTLTMLFY